MVNWGTGMDCIVGRATLGKDHSHWFSSLPRYRNEYSTVLQTLAFPGMTFLILDTPAYNVEALQKHNGNINDNIM